MSGPSERDNSKVGSNLENGWSERDEITALPWPDVQECHWPAPSLVAKRHTCAQCDGSHDHQWVAGDATHSGTPVRCRICGGRKCDVPACRLRRHHQEDHDEF